MAGSIQTGADTENSAYHDNTVFHFQLKELRKWQKIGYIFSTWQDFQSVLFLEGAQD